MHHIVKPPFDRDYLSQEKLRETAWLTKNCHGLEWDQGDIWYHVLEDLLRKCIARRPAVYVKGREKKEFIRQHFITDPSVTSVIDLSDMGCGSLGATTNLLSTNTIRCGQHKRIKSRCALSNCLVLRSWLFLSSTNVIEEEENECNSLCSCLCFTSNQSTVCIDEDQVG